MMMLEGCKNISINVKAGLSISRNYKHKKGEITMEIEKLISIVEDISLELARIRDIMEPEEYEPWFQDNLDQAHDLLLEVKDLIGA